MVAPKCSRTGGTPSPSFWRRDPPVDLCGEPLQHDAGGHALGPFRLTQRRLCLVEGFRAWALEIDGAEGPSPSKVGRPRRLRERVMLFGGTAPTTFDLCTLGLSLSPSVPLSVAVYDIDDAGQIVGFGHERRRPCSCDALQRDKIWRHGARHSGQIPLARLRDQ